MAQIPYKYLYLVPVIISSALLANAWNNKETTAIKESPKPYSRYVSLCAPSSSESYCYLICYYLEVTILYK